jgi:phosphate transport system substrate-binding protein
VLGVDGGSGCVVPSDQTITDKTYAPLSRPLFIYVKRSALERPEVDAFVRFFMEQAEAIVPTTGYLALEDAQYQQNLQTLAAPTGTQ